MSADDKALRNATGLVHDSNRTFEVRAAHMRRNKDVPSVECARRHCLRTY
ncbi:hypothetical protein [Desulfosporosinus sp. OT]|nr:hypothetical protein [Desulfosporosinus sp. OT]